MKKLLSIILIAAAITSCTKKGTSPAPYDRINDYATFISATNKTVTGANTAQVQLNAVLNNVYQIHDAHIYAYNNFYQMTLQVADGPQYVIDVVIQPSTTSRQYYFLVTLRNGEVITGKPFTVIF